MAITLDQINADIGVELVDLTLVSPGVYTLDTDAFRKTLRGLEDEVENAVYPITHSHIQPITVGGVTLGRVIEILPHWSVTFEDGQYRVILQGSNNNIADVATVNQVSVASTNSAGLVDTDPAASVWNALLTNHTLVGTFGWFIQKLLTVAKFLGLK